MEKNMKLASGSTEPSAPPPTAPPSYEEAVENAARLPRHPHIPPYPVGPSPMPVPIHNQPPIPAPVPTVPSYPPASSVPPYPPATNVPPYPPTYSGPSEPPSHSQTQGTANPSNVPAPEIRVVYQPVIYSLSSSPTKTTCPTCHASIKTITVSDHQLSAHLCCILLCLLGCFLCSCLPYYMSSFMDVRHFCPKCKNYIGKWKG